MVYGFIYLPSDTKSYDNKKFAGNCSDVSVVPLVLFCSLRFFTIGTTMIIMTMLGELFPLKIRSVACGMTTAFVNVLTFGAIKTFYNFELWTSLPGAFCIYAVLGVVGWVQWTIRRLIENKINRKRPWLAFQIDCVVFNSAGNGRPVARRHWNPLLKRQLWIAESCDCATSQKAQRNHKRTKSRRTTTWRWAIELVCYFKHM